MKYFKRFSGCIIVLMIFAAASAADTFLVEDFNRTSFVGPTGEPHNVWMVNPDDPTGGTRADFAPNEDGYALVINYSVDSPLTYLYDEAYIQDYSEYSIIGLASEGIPHMVPCGYFFLLGNKDLSGYEYLVFSARGDENTGYTRRFQLELKTRDRTSRFMLDGISSDWKKFVIPLDVFDGINDWESITELTITFNENVTAERGRIYLDDIYFAVDPEDVPSAAGGRNMDRSLNEVFEYRFHPTAGVSANFRHTPERGGELFSAAETVFQGQAGDLTGRIKTSLATQEFGSSGYRKGLDEWPFSRFEVGDRNVTFPTVQLMVDGLTPLASRITVGHLYLGYSQHLFSPQYGWKGIKADGAYDLFDHSTFLIKRQLNSFSAGSRGLAYLGDHRLTMLGVYDQETAALDTSKGYPGVLADGEMDIRKVTDEFSWMANALFRFMDYRLNLELSYGDFRKRRHAPVPDYDDPEKPVYNGGGSDDFPSVGDSMYEAKIDLQGLPLYGSRMQLSYREIGEDFAPAYRQEPGMYEELFMDQRGFNARAQQWYNEYGISLYYDTLNRLSDSDYYRDVINYGLHYRGPRDMELGLIREHNREEYKRSVFPRGDMDRVEVNVDREIVRTILSGSYNFLYEDTPGLRYPLTVNLEFRQDRIDNKLENIEETDHALKVGVDYQLKADLGFSANYEASTNNETKFEVFLSGNFY